MTDKTGKIYAPDPRLKLYNICPVGSQELGKQTCLWLQVADAGVGNLANL